MHEQIFIGALVVHILVLALRPWRKLEHWEPPPVWHPPVFAIRSGFAPTRKKKGPRAKFPAGFA
jgi:hypothetical protein